MLGEGGGVAWWNWLTEREFWVGCELLLMGSLCLLKGDRPSKDEGFRLRRWIIAEWGFS